MTTIGSKRGNKTITLNDAAGIDELIIRDSDRVPVVKITSKGDLKLKGGVKKI